MSWIYVLDLFGTFVFAVSGVLTAIEKRFDLVGSLVIGFVTAIGGGTIRDLLIGRSPVGWLDDRMYILVVLLAFVLSYLFYTKIRNLRKSMFLFDTLGIGLFTVLGIQTALRFNLRLEAALIMGVVSAVFGGVVRDVLSNEIPLIFRKEIYATACLAGGVIYLLLESLSSLHDVNIIVSICCVILIRYFSIRKGWSLQLNLLDRVNNSRD